MTNPQQPELRRTGLGEVVEDAAKSRSGGPSDETGPVGAVPEENEPGHHPERDQDKPDLDAFAERLGTARADDADG